MKRIVQISTLGSNGRFGNQLFQYVFARTYAETIGAELQTPPWMGETLFGVKDARLSERLPQVSEADVMAGPVIWRPNVDLYGWFQKPAHLRWISKSAVHRWLTIKEEWLFKRGKALPQYAACHLRQGDFPTDPGRYCLVTRRSYQDALAKYLPGVPVIWVEENWSKPSPDLPPDLQFWPDWLTLFNADWLLRSNSTFAWWAGELGPHFGVFSPVVGNLHGPHHVAFAPGNDQQHAPFPGHGPLRFGRP